MPTEVQVNVKVNDASARSSIQNLQMILDRLSKEAVNMQIGDSKANAEATRTVKELAQALHEIAKAEKETANAASQRAKAQEASSKQAISQLKADQQRARADAENAKSRAQSAKADAESAKAKTELAKAETELARAEQLRAKAQLQTTQANLAKQNAAEKEALELATRKARLEKETANQLTAESKMYMQAEKQSQQRIQQAQREAKEIEKAYQQIRKAEEEAYANRGNTGIQNQIDSMLRIGEAAKSAQESMRTFELSGFFSQKDGGSKNDIVEEAKQATVSFQELGKSAMGFVKQVVGFYGAAQSMRYALGEMKSLSDEMVTYRKVTGATAQEMEKIRESAYDTAKKYGQSPTDFMSSASEMARAGYGKNAVAMAELATKTQLVGDMTADTASKFLLAVDAGYKYQGNIEKLSSVLDAANEVDNNFATSIEKIADGMTLIASLGGQAGVPIEQLIAALGTMTAATQRSGSEMARGLRSVLLNVMGDTTTEIEEGVTVTEDNIHSLTEALDKYGDASIANARKAGKIINPMEAITSLAKAWKEGKLDEVTLFKISEDISGQRYYNAFASLIQNYDTLYLPMLEAIKNSFGSANNEIAAMMDSWSVKVNQLKTTFVQMVDRSIDEGFIKDLLDGGTAAMEFAGSLENLALMAGGAYGAIKALSTGISNLQAANLARALGQNVSGSGAQIFGGLNIATAIAGVAATGIGIWKSAYEKNIRDIQKAANEAVNKAIAQANSAKSLESISKRYSDIAADGIQTEKGELQELNSLQSELNSLVGAQASAIDLVNGKYDETAKKLGELTTQQREAAEAALRTSLTTAVNSFNTSDLAGAFNRFMPARRASFADDFYAADVGIDAWDNQFVRDWLSNAQYLTVSRGLFTNDLYFKKPENAEEITAFYNEVKDFYTFLATTTTTGEKATGGMKSIGDEYTQMFSELGNWLNVVSDASEPVVAAWEALQEALKDANKEIENVGESGKSSSSAGDGLNAIADSAHNVETALQAATAAKERFDAAMQNTKADGMNAYITAFKTLEGEIEAGRVNSTAFYASARMLMGDELYNETGASSQAVMQRMNYREEGTSGSLMDAQRILNAQYYDASGKELEDFGIYALLSQTQGFTQDKLTSATGSAFIPDLSQEQLSQISAQWNGLSVDLILAFMDAFDQHDIEGAATDAAVKAAEKKKEGEDANTDATDSATESTNTNTEAQSNLAQAESQAAEGAQAAAEATSAAADQMQEAAETSRETAEGMSEEQGENLEAAQESANALLDVLEKCQAVYAELSRATIMAPDGAGLEIQQLADNLEKLKEKVTIDISLGGKSNAVAETVEAFKTQIEAIRGFAKDGVIPINVAIEATGDLKDGLTSLLGSAEGEQEQATIQVAIEAVDKLTAELNAMVEGNQGKTVEIGVQPNEGDIGKTNAEIDAIASQGRTATIDVGAETSGAIGEAKSAVDEINSMKASIKVSTETTGGTNAPASNAAGASGTSTGLASTVGNGAGIGNSVGGGGGFLDRISFGFDGFAEGTRNHPGGISLVNDGNGPELLVSGGRAFIAGGGRPTLVRLNRGDKVFTATETRSILSGGSVPAYAGGTTGLGSAEYGTSATGWSTKPSSSASTENSGSTAAQQSSYSDSGASSASSNAEKQETEEEKSEAFSNLAEMVNYIINRIGKALEEQLGILDRQIDELRAQKEAAEQQNELEEKQKAVAEAQKDLQDALNERTVRYLGEDGRWHWMADARNVQKAQENLQKAQEDLAKYESDMAYEEQIKAIEAQKQALQDEYDQITDIWQRIQEGVNTPTGTLQGLLNEVFSSGTPQEKTGANALRDYLIRNIILGGNYSGNFSEAIGAIAKATAGSPIMPSADEASLAALIAAGGGTTDSLEEILQTTETAKSGKNFDNLRDKLERKYGNSIVYNYYVDGMEIDNETAQTKPLSEVMNGLKVYAGRYS